MNSMQYLDNICEAIDIIAKNVVKGLNFDQTILCTITDDSQAKKGEYLVTDGSSIYNVISNNHTYKTGTQVYVLIPKGDYSQQKIIVSEYSIEKEQDENNKGYIKPIDTIIPVEEIEIEFDNNIEELGLIANSAQALGQGSATSDINKDLELDTQYTRLSVEASFKTGFDQDIISGDYSLVFFLSGELMNGAEVEKRQYLFNCDRFFGNPYHFDTEVSQSIVFDISDFKTLDKIEIRFQESGNFYAEGNEFLQYALEEGEEPEENLFAKNIKLILGFGIEEYQNNDLILTSKDSLEYNHEEEKNLQLNWIRKRNNNTMFSINYLNDNPLDDNSLNDINGDNYKYLKKLKDAGYLSIYWYKYLLTPTVIQDPYTKDYFYSVEKSYNNTIYNDDAIKDKFEDGENPFTFSFETNTAGRAFERIKSAIAITGCLRKKILKTQFITTDDGTITEVTVLKKKERPFYILEDNWNKELEADWKKEYELDYDYVYYDPLDEINPDDILIDSSGILQYYWDGTKYVLYTNEEKQKETVEQVRQYEQRELSMSTRYPNGEIEINRDSNGNIIYNETSSFIYLSADEHDARSKECAYYIKNTGGSEEYYELVGQNYVGNEELKSIKAYDLKLVPTTFLTSNPVTFENNFTEVIDLGNVNLIDKLELECLDELKGKYFIYGEDNTIPASVANNTQRYIQTTFNFINSKDVISDPVEIQWKIPANITMIADPLPDTPYSGLMTGPKKEEKITGKIKWDLDKDFWIGKITLSERTESNRLQDEGIYSISIKIPYQIKSYYSPSLVNNTIQCIVSKPLVGKTPIENKSEHELRFGPAGMNGTNYVFTLSLGPAYERIATENATASSSLGVAKLGTSILNINGYLYQVKDPQRRSFIKKIDTDTYIFVEPSLYDGKNLLLEDLDPKEISWSWYNSSNKYTSSKSTIDFIDIDDKCYLKSTYNETDNQYQAEDHCAILQADIVYNNIKLTAYLPIPMAFDDNVIGVELADKIIYNSDGVNPTYYKNPSKIFIDNIEEVNISNAIFVNRVRLDNSDNDGQYPLFKSDSLCAITVPPIYYKNQEKDLISISLIGPIDNTLKTLFVQPILIIQNRFGNAMLNEWDGSLIIDKENNRILSAQVAAGEKNSDNSFSGILMGAVGKNSLDDSTTKYGLYGYRYGALSFGFKEDGTAFIGNSGSGRIEFNGNQGLIQSSNYIMNGIGMSINLSTGELISNGAGGKVTINPTLSNSLFNIRNNLNKTLINIGTNNNFLQSSNYSRTTGFKFAFDTNGFSLAQPLPKTENLTNAGFILASLSPYFRIAKNYNNYARNIKMVYGSTAYYYDMYIHPLGTALVVKNVESKKWYKIDGINSIQGFIEQITNTKFNIKYKENQSNSNSIVGYHYRILGDMAIEQFQKKFFNFDNFKEFSLGGSWSYDEQYDKIIYSGTDIPYEKLEFHIAEYAPEVKSNENKQIFGNYATNLGHANSIAHHMDSNVFFVAIGNDPLNYINRIVGFRYLKEVKKWDCQKSFFLNTPKNEPLNGNIWDLAIEENKNTLYVLSYHNSKWSIFSFILNYNNNNNSINEINLERESSPDINSILIANSSISVPIDNNQLVYQGMAVDDLYYYFPAYIRETPSIVVLDMKKKSDGTQVYIESEGSYKDNSGHSFIKFTNLDTNYELEELAFSNGYMYLSFTNVKQHYLVKIYKIKFNNKSLPGKIDLHTDPEEMWIIPQTDKNINEQRCGQGFTIGYDKIENDLFFINAFIREGTSFNKQPRMLTLNYLKDITPAQMYKYTYLIDISTDNFILQSANFYYDTDYPKRSRGMGINLNTGQLIAVNANISGTIIATAGEIGGWTIADWYLKYPSDASFGTENTMFLCPSGSTIGASIGGSESITGWTFTSGTTFGITKEGKLYANAGKIGGWTIDSNILKYPSDASFGGDQTVFLSPEGTLSGLSIGGSPSGSNKKWVITVGNKFGVTTEGKLYATEANISGTINATAGEIGGCKIVNEVLQIGSANIGTISANKISGGILDFSKITVSNLDAGSINTGSLSINSTQIVDGAITSGKIATNAITSDKIATNAITSGKIAANAITADKIATGTITADKIQTNTLSIGVSQINLGKVGGFFGMQGSDLLLGVKTGTQQIAAFGVGDIQAYIISISDSGKTSQISVNASEDYQIYLSGNGLLGGSWYLNNSPLTASDEKKKYSIRILNDSRYNNFFDTLRPTLFKYKDGTSGRDHLGFISQQVEISLDLSNIDSKEFAGFAKLYNNRTNEYDYYLRYEEFVALNTWQIQKLKTRVLELENKILELEAKL